MHATTLANNLYPLHRNCFSGCHCGSLTIYTAHASKQIEGSLIKQGGADRTLTYFHIDIAEVHTEQGKLYLLVGIDRTSKFAFVELHERVSRRTAADFLQALIKAVPYRVHIVLTDNGTHFTTPGNIRAAAADIRLAIQNGELSRAHPLEYACAKADIDHRLTKPRHPWTNGGRAHEPDDQRRDRQAIPPRYT